MNFWHMQLHPKDDNWGLEREVLEKTGYIGMGHPSDAQQKDFEKKMQVGDIVAVKRGQRLIALTEIIGDYEYTEEVTDLDWFERRRKVKILDWYKDEYNYKVAWLGTLNICAGATKNTTINIKKWYEKVMKNNIQTKKVIELLEYKRQIILQGPPGTGKTRLAKLVAEDMIQSEDAGQDGEYKVIQFHPAYTYEDFVRGVVAKTNEDGNIHYKVENKVLAQFAKKAYKNPNSNYVLIIDEINRANLPSVLGELIYALEYRGETVESMYELLEKDDENMQAQNTGRNITLPKNIYIIGTMNTADRSVGYIDYAIRRRFAFYDVPPTIEVIEFAKAKALFEQIQALFKTDGSGHLSSDFNASDVQLGHSYFLPSKKGMSEQDFYIELKDKLDYEIRPILLEYIKDGVLLDSAREAIEALDV